MQQKQLNIKDLLEINWNVILVQFAITDVWLTKFYFIIIWYGITL